MGKKSPEGGAASADSTRERTDSKEERARSPRSFPVKYRVHAEKSSLSNRVNSCIRSLLAGSVGTGAL